MTGKQEKKDAFGRRRSYQNAPTQPAKKAAAVRLQGKDVQQEEGHTLEHADDNFGQDGARNKLMHSQVAADKGLDYMACEEEEIATAASNSGRSKDSSSKEGRPVVHGSSDIKHTFGNGDRSEANATNPLAIMQQRALATLPSEWLFRFYGLFTWPSRRSTEQRPWQTQPSWRLHWTML